MSSFLSRVHVHLVWATSRRNAFITRDVEAAVQEQLVDETRRKRCHVLAVGGVEDHIHMLLWMHPACSISSLVSVAKTASSRVMHKTFGRRFRWQTGYGAFAVQPRALDDVIRYVRSQREHHRRGTTIPALERTTSPFDDASLTSPCDLGEAHLPALRPEGAASLHSPAARRRV